MMADAPDRDADLIYQLRRAHRLPAGEWTPVPVREDGAIVPERPVTFVDVTVVVGNLRRGDLVYLRLEHDGESRPSVMTNTMHGATDRFDGWTTYTDADLDAPADGSVDEEAAVDSPARAGADASTIRLALPFAVPAGQSLTVTVQAEDDATILPVTVLPNSGEEVRTEVQLWQEAGGNG